MENKVSLEIVNKFDKYIKDDMNIENFMSKFHISTSELNGIIELFKLYEKEIKIVEKKGTLVFKKKNKKIVDINKPKMKDLIHTELCIVSDTHFGSIHQQLHLLNKIYKEAYNRGITNVLHCGDIVDGNYTNRPEQPRQQFLHGFDEQASYVVDMYPEVKGIKTSYILGSHDETHYKNGQSTLNEWINRCRKDMNYLGQDNGTFEINNMTIAMDHPGGGSAQSLSYKPQKRIEILESRLKPEILLIGHYHKSYEFVYRNVRGLAVPCLCDKTQFQQKQGLSNIVGAYFLDIYSNPTGKIEYFEAEEILYDQKDIWDESGKDKSKVKKLKI